VRWVPRLVGGGILLRGVVGVAIFGIAVVAPIFASAGSTAASAVVASCRGLCVRRFFFRRVGAFRLVGEIAARSGFALPEPIAHREGLFGAGTDSSTSGFSGLVSDSFLPGEASRPYGSWFDQVVDVLEELIVADGLAVADVIEKVTIDRGQLGIFIAREHIARVAKYLRDDPDLRFEMCLGTNGAHYPLDKGRELHAIYPLYSITHNRMIRLEVTCPDEDPRIPSIVSVYPGNDWQERETWDLIGIVFTGHPSLTRTAMPDDWVGHPQRKDYPLGGIPVEFKGAVTASADVRRSVN